MQPARMPPLPPLLALAAAVAALASCATPARGAQRPTAPRPVADGHLGVFGSHTPTIRSVDAWPSPDEFYTEPVFYLLLLLSCLLGLCWWRGWCCVPVFARVAGSGKVLGTAATRRIMPPARRQMLSRRHRPTTNA